MNDIKFRKLVIFLLSVISFLLSVLIYLVAKATLDDDHLTFISTGLILFWIGYLAYALSWKSDHHK